MVSSLDRFTWRESALGLALAGFLVPPFLPLAALGWPHGLGTLTLGSIYWWSLAAVWVVALGDPDGAEVRSGARYTRELHSQRGES